MNKQIHKKQSMGAVVKDVKETWGWRKVYGGSPIFLILKTVKRAWMYNNLCRKNGHKWVEELGYSSPDFGYREIECKRCGYGFQERMY